MNVPFSQWPWGHRPAGAGPLRCRCVRLGIALSPFVGEQAGAARARPPSRQAGRVWRKRQNPREMRDSGETKVSELNSLTLEARRSPGLNGPGADSLRGSPGKQPGLFAGACWFQGDRFATWLLRLSGELPFRSASPANGQGARSGGNYTLQRRSAVQRPRNRRFQNNSPALRA